MRWTLYKDQEDCVNRCMDYINSYDKSPAIAVLPTGSGKSLIVSEIAERIGGGLLVLHLSSDLLSQNLEKLQNLNCEATVYSAGLGSRVISKLTYATLKSVKDLGKEMRAAGIKAVIIDECDRNFSPKKGSLFMKFIEDLKPSSVIGFTATPWYLRSNQAMTYLEFMTSGYGAYFKKVLYVSQIQSLVEAGRWTPCDYELYEISTEGLVVNTNGSDYTQESILQSNETQGINRAMSIRIQELLRDGYTSILVFVDCIENVKRFDAWLDCSAALTDETSAKDRKKIVADFKSGKTKVLFNYGMLGVGFDYPGLQVVMMGRPTMSLSLLSQIYGRGVRTHPDKKAFKFIDFGGNVTRFGRLENIRIEYVEGIGWSMLQGSHVLSGVPIGSKWTVEEVRTIKKTSRNKEVINPKITFWFGKHKGKHLNKVPVYYLKWWLEKISEEPMTAQERELFDEVNKVMRNKVLF